MLPGPSPKCLLELDVAATAPLSVSPSLSSPGQPRPIAFLLPRARAFGRGIWEPSEPPSYPRPSPNEASPMSKRTPSASVGREGVENGNLGALTAVARCAIHHAAEHATSRHRKKQGQGHCRVRVREKDPRRPPSPDARTLPSPSPPRSTNRLRRAVRCGRSWFPRGRALRSDPKPPLRTVSGQQAGSWRGMAATTRGGGDLKVPARQPAGCQGAWPGERTRGCVRSFPCYVPVSAVRSFILGNGLIRACRPRRGVLHSEAVNASRRPE
ncbi:hypothetical protein B0T16DRAFT_81130 [Cercophora newfieldiana]|uniref:Uncharacterized protein n=1 Tax=Cercophora newfieldiana TaxID=92897 RepID=A0AA39YHA0_9PEZI|nr:hypothetical protein B0T16DRAFT_81130 [Cercophora newfieldiana]